MGLSSCGSGGGALLLPLILDALYTNFGWRGTLLLVGGIALNLVVYGALFRPLDGVKSSWDKQTPSLVATPSEEDITDAEYPAKRLRTRSGQRWISRTFRTDILTNFPFKIYCLNQLLHNFCQSIIYVHLSAHANNIGFTDHAANRLFVYLGLGSLLGRLIIGIVLQWSRVGSMPIVIGGQTIAGIMTLSCPAMKSYNMLVGFAVVYGLTAPSLGLLIGTLPMEILGADALPFALGYIGVFAAVGFLAGGPIAGRETHLIRQ